MTSDKHSPFAPIILAGCAPDSGNLGVVALGYSLAIGLTERLPNQPIVLLGFGGNRVHSMRHNGTTLSFDVLGLNHSRRLYSPNASSNLGLLLKLGTPWTKLASTLQQARLLIDISAGDSFSDIYGQHRYDGVCFLKEVMLRLGKPVIFLPQTYGPFATDESRERASQLVREARACWARDEDSFQVLRDLLKDDFDPAKHRQGVDVAFLLPVKTPSKTVTELVEAKSANGQRMIGLNISGLVYNTPEQSKVEFKLKADYRRVVHELLLGLLEQSEHQVALISHVFGGNDRDSDPPACQAVYEQLPTHLRERVWVAPTFDDPREIKWLISQCDWFCGTRMHATIAGLSSGTATASIAYSMKTRGVFESCGVADQVIDPRHLDTEEVVRQTLQSFHDRDTTRARLAAALPATLEIARLQMDDIAALIV